MKPINRLLVVEIVTTALVVTSASTGAQTEKSESSNNADARRLNTLLNPDGTLNLTTGFSGNVDSSGWALASGPGGEPRFTRTDSHQSEDVTAAAAGDELWDDQFLLGVYYSPKIDLSVSIPIGEEGQIFAIGRPKWITIIT